MPFFRNSTTYTDIPSPYHYGSFSALTNENEARRASMTRVGQGLPWCGLYCSAILYGPHTVTEDLDMKCYMELKQLCFMVLRFGLLGAAFGIFEQRHCGLLRQPRRIAASQRAQVPISHSK